jgi:hypothetical protein
MYHGETMVRSPITHWRSHRTTDFSNGRFTTHRLGCNLVMESLVLVSRNVYGKFRVICISLSKFSLKKRVFAPLFFVGMLRTEILTISFEE